jgi:hypothetical protein
MVIMNGEGWGWFDSLFWLSFFLAILVGKLTAEIQNCYWFRSMMAGWWFQTFFIFHNIWDHPSH